MIVFVLSVLEGLRCSEIGQVVDCELFPIRELQLPDCIATLVDVDILVHRGRVQHLRHKPDNCVVRMFEEILTTNPLQCSGHGCDRSTWAQSSFDDLISWSRG